MKLENTLFLLLGLFILLTPKQVEAPAASVTGCSSCGERKVVAI